MNEYNILLLGCFLGLSRDHSERFSAIVLAVMMLVYWAFVANLSTLLYYGLAATLEAVVAVMLFRMIKGNNLVALLSLLLVLINFYGWAIYEAYWEPLSYNVAAMFTRTLQVVVIFVGYSNARLGTNTYWCKLVRHFDNACYKLRLQKKNRKVEKT